MGLPSRCGTVCDSDQPEFACQAKDRQSVREYENGNSGEIVSRSAPKIFHGACVVGIDMCFDCGKMNYFCRRNSQECESRWGISIEHQQGLWVCRLPIAYRRGESCTLREDCNFVDGREAVEPFSLCSIGDHGTTTTTRSSYPSALIFGDASTCHGVEFAMGRGDAEMLLENGIDPRRGCFGRK